MRIAWWLLAFSLAVAGGARWHDDVPSAGPGGHVEGLDGGGGLPPTPKAP
jgi:hypothetical protein